MIWEILLLFTAFKNINCLILEIKFLFLRFKTLVKNIKSNQHTSAKVNRSR